MPVYRGTFKADQERPKTKAEANARIAEQKAESVKVNAMLRGSRGSVSIMQKKQSKSDLLMNSFIRGDPPPAAEFTEEDLNQAAKEDLETLQTIKASRAEKLAAVNKRAAQGNAGEGTGMELIKKKKDDVNSRIRDAMAERKRLGY